MPKFLSPLKSLSEPGTSGQNTNVEKKVKKVLKQDSHVSKTKCESSEHEGVGQKTIHTSVNGILMRKKKIPELCSSTASKNKPKKGQQSVPSNAGCEVSVQVPVSQSKKKSTNNELPQTGTNSPGKASYSKKGESSMGTKMKGLKHSSKVVKNVNSVENGDSSEVAADFAFLSSNCQVSDTECVKDILNDKSASTSSQTKTVMLDAESMQTQTLYAINNCSKAPLSTQDPIMATGVLQIEPLDNELIGDKLPSVSSFSDNSSSQCYVSANEILLERHFGEKCQLSSRVLQHTYLFSINEFVELVDSLSDRRSLSTDTHSSSHAIDSDSDLSNTESIPFNLKSKGKSDAKLVAIDASHTSNLCNRLQKSSESEKISNQPITGCTAFLSTEDTLVSCTSNKTSLESELQSVVSSVDSIQITHVITQNSRSNKSHNGDMLAVDVQEKSPEKFDDDVNSEITAIRSKKPLFYDYLTPDLNPRVVVKHLSMAECESFLHPDKGTHNEMSLILDFHVDETDESSTQSSSNIFIADLQKKQEPSDPEIIDLASLDCTDKQIECDVAKSTLAFKSSLSSVAPSASSIQHSDEFQLLHKKIRSSDSETPYGVRTSNAAITDDSVKLIEVNVVLQDIMANNEQLGSSKVSTPEKTNEIELSVLHGKKTCSNAFSSTEPDYSNNKGSDPKSSISVDSSLKNANINIKRKNEKYINKSRILNFCDLDYSTHSQDANNNSLMNDCENTESSELVQTTLSKMETSAFDMPNYHATSNGSVACSSSSCGEVMEVSMMHAEKVISVCEDIAITTTDIVLGEGQSVDKDGCNVLISESNIAHQLMQGSVVENHDGETVDFSNSTFMISNIETMPYEGDACKTTEDLPQGQICDNGSTPPMLDDDDIIIIGESKEMSQEEQIPSSSGAHNSKEVNADTNSKERNKSSPTVSSIDFKHKKFASSKELTRKNSPEKHSSFYDIEAFVSEENQKHMASSDRENMESNVENVSLQDKQNISEAHAKNNFEQHTNDHVILVTSNSDSSSNISVDSAVQSAESITHAETNTTVSKESILFSKVDELRHSNEVETSLINTSLSSMNYDNDSGFVMDFVKQFDNSNEVSKLEIVEDVQSSEVPLVISECHSILESPKIKIQDISKEGTSKSAEGNCSLEDTCFSGEMCETTASSHYNDNSLEEGEILDTDDLSKSPEVSRHRSDKTKKKCKKRKSCKCVHKCRKEKKRIIDNLKPQSLGKGSDIVIQEDRNTSKSFSIVGSANTLLVSSEEKHVLKNKLCKSKPNSAVKRKLCRSSSTFHRGTSETPKTGESVEISGDQWNSSDIMTSCETPTQEESVCGFSPEDLKRISVTVPVTGATRKIMLADQCINNDKSDTVQHPCISSVKFPSKGTMQEFCTTNNEMPKRGNLNCEALINKYSVIDSTLSREDAGIDCNNQVTLPHTCMSPDETVVDESAKTSVQDKVSQKHVHFATKSVRKNSDKVKTKLRRTISKKCKQPDLRSYTQKNSSKESLQTVQVDLQEPTDAARSVTVHEHFEFESGVPTKNTSVNHTTKLIVNADLDDDLYEELDFEPYDHESHTISGNAYNSAYENTQSDDVARDIVQAEDHIDQFEPTSRQSVSCDIQSMKTKGDLIPETTNADDLVESSVNSLQDEVCDEEFVVPPSLENQATSSVDHVQCENYSTSHFRDTEQFVNEMNMNNSPDFEETETEEEMEHSFKRSRTKVVFDVPVTETTLHTNERTNDVARTYELQPISRSTGISEQNAPTVNVSQPPLKESQVNVSHLPERYFPSGYCFDFLKRKPCKKKCCNFRHEVPSELERVEEALSQIVEDCKSGLFRKACKKSEELMKWKLPWVKQDVISILLEAAEECNNPDLIHLVYELMEKSKAFTRDTCSKFILSCKAKAREALSCVEKVFDVCVNSRIQITSSALSALHDLFCLDRSSWLPLLRLINYKLAICKETDIDLKELREILLYATVLREYRPESVDLLHPLCSVLVLLPSLQFQSLPAEHIENIVKLLEKSAHQSDNVEELKSRYYKYFCTNKASDTPEIQLNIQARCLNLNQNVGMQTSPVHFNMTNGNLQDVAKMYIYAVENENFHIITDLHQELNSALSTACEKLKFIISFITGGNDSINMLFMKHAFLLASIGASLILQAIATRQLKIAMDIFCMLWSFNIDLAQWLVAVKAAGFLREKDRDMYKFAAPPYRIALQIADLCIQCEDYEKAIDFLQGNLWIPMDNDEVKPSTEDFELRTNLLITLCYSLFKRNKLAEGTEVLRVLLKALHEDDKFARMSVRHTEGINRWYNRYLAAMLNKRDLEAAEDLYSRRHNSLDVCKSIMRAFIILAMECGKTERSKEIFTYSKLKGVYSSCTYNASSYPRTLKLFTYLSKCEIYCILDYYLNELFGEWSKAEGKSNEQYSLNIVLEEPLSSFESGEVHLAAIDEISTCLSDAYIRTISVLKRMDLAAQKPNGNFSRVVSVTTDSLYRKFLLWQNEQTVKNCASVASGGHKLSPRFGSFRWQPSEYESPFKSGSDSTENVSQNIESLAKKTSPNVQYESHSSSSFLKSPSQIAQNLTLSPTGSSESKSARVSCYLSNMQPPHLPGDTGEISFTADAVKSVKTSHDVEVAWRIPTPPIPAKKMLLSVESKNLDAAIQTKKPEHYIQRKADNENPRQSKGIPTLKRKSSQSELKDGFLFDKNKNFNISITFNDSTDDSSRTVRTSSWNETNLDSNKSYCSDLNPPTSEGSQIPENNSICDSSTMQPSAAKVRKLVRTDKYDSKQSNALNIMQRLRHAERPKSNAQPKTSAIPVTPAVEEQTTVITSPSEIANVFKRSPTTTSFKSAFTFVPIAEAPENSTNKQVTEGVSHHPNTSLSSSSVSSSFIKPIASTPRTLKRSSLHQARARILSRSHSPCRSVRNPYLPRSCSPFRDLCSLRKKRSLADQTEDDRSNFSDIKSVKGRVYHYILTQIFLKRKTSGNAEAIEGAASAKAVELTRMFIQQNNLSNAIFISKEGLKKLTEFTKSNL